MSDRPAIMEALDKFHGEYPPEELLSGSNYLGETEAWEKAVDADDAGIPTSVDPPIFLELLSEHVSIADRDNPSYTDDKENVTDDSLDNITFDV